MPDIRPDIRRVTDAFAVAGQLAPEDIAAVAAQGFKMVISNRPDGESPGQPSSAAMEAAVRAAGMAYVHAPVSGPASPRQIEDVYAAVSQAQGPVLAFCRSGTRSITTWAKGQVALGGRGASELMDLARNAGYDLSGALGG